AAPGLYARPARAAGALGVRAAGPRLAAGARSSAPRGRAPPRGRAAARLGGARRLGISRGPCALERSAGVPRPLRQRTRRHRGPRLRRGGPVRAVARGTHLSRLAAELVLYSTAEFGFVRLSDDFST